MFDKNNNLWKMPIVPARIINSSQKEILEYLNSRNKLTYALGYIKNTIISLFSPKVIKNSKSDQKVSKVIE